MNYIQGKSYNNQLQKHDIIKANLETKNKQLQKEENIIRDSINNKFNEFEETIDNLKKDVDDCNKKLINKQNELDNLNESINKNIITTQKNLTNEINELYTQLVNKEKEINEYKQTLVQLNKNSLLNYQKGGFYKYKYIKYLKKYFKVL